MTENGTFFQLILFENNATKAQQKRCLKSIKEQKYEKFQYTVVSDEGLSWQQLKSRLSGDYVLLMSMTDRLSDDALIQFAKKIEEVPEAQWIYGDEELFRCGDKKKGVPHFKPEWSKETFLSFFYTGNAAVYQTRLCKKIETWDMSCPVNRNYDFAIRFLELCDEDEIYHIPSILYQSYQLENDETTELYLRRIKEDYVKRNGLAAKVEKEERTGEYRLVYQAEGKVSIVIPSKDNVDILLKCIDSVEEVTNYENYDIVVVDNGSSSEHKEYLETVLKEKNIRYLYEPMEFNFSHMCNIGAQATDGEFILFLNDDIECVDEKWLGRMVGQAMQDGIGAVGAKLLYPTENRIQHIGVVNVGTQIGPAHVLTKEKDDKVLAYGRNCLDYNYDAVTAACMLVKRSVFRQVNGFCEEFPISYNDVDFCYRLRELGLRNVVRTDAVLIHHESVSRGLDSNDEKKMNRLKKEREYLYQRHSWIVEEGDHSYNENYTVERTDFSLADKDVPKEYNWQIKGKKYTNKPFSVIIDRMVDSQDGKICGWFYFRNDTYTNLSDVYLVFKKKETKEELWYSTYKQARPDVAEVMNHQAVNCGFVCKIPKEDIKKLQGFQVGVCIKLYNFKINLMTWTDVVVD